MSDPASCAHFTTTLQFIDLPELALEPIRNLNLRPEDGAIALKGLGVGGAGIGIRIGATGGETNAFLSDVLGQEWRDRAVIGRRTGTGDESGGSEVIGVVRTRGLWANAAAAALLQRLARGPVADRSLLSKSVVDPDYLAGGMVIGGERDDRLTGRPRPADGAGWRRPGDRRG